MGSDQMKENHHRQRRHLEPRASALAEATPRWYKDAKNWASTVNERIAARAWHEQSTPVAGEAYP
jgi:hypothetical protein